ncbi:hypothetical protein [Microbacterium sp. A93]
MTKIQAQTNSVDAVILRPAQLPTKDRGSIIPISSTTHPRSSSS